jgi:AraC-like DNA-binding protein
MLDQQTSSLRPPPDLLGFDLTSMQAALDRVNYGFVLLDRDLSSRFINRAFRQLWQLPNEKADSSPTFADLVQHGRDTKAYAVPTGQIDAYVSRRIDLVRAGNVPKLDLRLNSGKIIRLECKPLADGARVLTYFDITDLLEEAVVTYPFAQPPEAVLGLARNERRGVVPWQVRRTEKFIEASWDQPLNMDVIASAVGASKRTIFRVFQETRGYSPKVFAKQVRLRHARNMLETADAATTTVTDVAFTCGFNDLGHFSRDYRANFGELPSRALQYARRDQAAASRPDCQGDQAVVLVTPDPIL